MLIRVIVCAALAAPHLFSAVWAWPATIFTVGYLLLVAAHPHGRVLLWTLAGPFLIIATYTAPGWNLWYRAAVMGWVAVVTLMPSTPNTPIPINREREQNKVSRFSKSPRRERRGDLGVRLLTITVSLALTILLTYALDRSVGLVAGERQPGGLVFPRGSVVAYDTPEFNHRVIINEYGFRGADADLSRNEDCRVMLLGDSFTYGWGVDYEQTWSALLENALRADGTDARVLNLGIPGGAPPDYAAIAGTAGPLIVPDVVLVGILQGDDMRQITREPGVFPRTLTFGEQATPAPLAEYVTFHYPHIAERTMLRGLSARRVSQTWAATAASFLSAHSPEGITRYAAVPADIRADFEAGRINPHFVELAVTAPNYWNWPLQDPATLEPYITMLTDDLTTIQATIGEARVLVVSIPHGAYTQPEAHAALQRLGFTLPADTLTNAFVDDAIEQAADAAGLPLITATDAFRADETLAFYPVDGHFNPHGNTLLANALTDDVRAGCAG